MLFIVTLTYRAAMAVIDTYRPAHRDWLALHICCGRILTAGPLEGQGGGLLVACCESRGELDALLASDPFVSEALVEVSVQGVAPAMRHPDFPSRWAPSAKAMHSPA